jgi:hypothetical protein
VKHQLLIMKRARRRPPHLCVANSNSSGKEKSEARPACLAQKI